MVYKKLLLYGGGVNTVKIQKILVLMVLVAGIGGVLLHVRFKRGLEPQVISGLAAYREESRRWDGKFPPDFILPLRDGESFRLADHIGRDIIILNFFTTWCKPCKEEMPELNTFAVKHRGGHVLLVGINVDEKPAVVDSYLAKLKLAFPVGIDTNALIAKQYGVQSYPTTVMIGIDGRVGLFKVGTIMNADVVLEPLVTVQLNLLQQGLGISREAYEAGFATQRPPAGIGRSRSSTVEKPQIVLGDAERRFAERMKCPSCHKALYTCRCGLCESVKERLSTLAITNLTDEQVLRALFMEGTSP